MKQQNKYNEHALKFRAKKKNQSKMNLQNSKHIVHSKAPLPGIFNFALEPVSTRHDMGVVWDLTRILHVRTGHFKLKQSSLQ